ncbi:hypothetical protein IW492_12130 [Enterococcus sp. BWB1-3]|uniref:hypothetical protein n=1 Tax=Enterococcus sp. BWB1-3 TaxID=2787713 RepID=UPI001922850D|nr:hypothetical protein [Enterococcus sp. BWB1-3]MBL1229982.1 hypothetical protein [Enterococcus sp. BWB1-3]
MDLPKEIPKELPEPDYMLTEHLEMATNFCNESSYFQRENLHAYYRSFYLENHHSLSQLGRV